MRMATKVSKTKLFLLLLTLILSLTSPLITVPIAMAANITLITTPPTNLDTVPNGTTISLAFQAIFEGSTLSLAHFVILFNTTAWTYTGFSAQMEGVNTKNQFTETVEDGHLNLTAAEIHPANGTLSLTINFTAQPVEGNYVFTWSYLYSAVPPPGPQMPAHESNSGTTSIVIIPEFPPTIFLPLLIILSLIALILSKSRLRRKPDTEFAHKSNQS